MRKIILLTLSVLCLALQPMSAQKKNEGTGEYKYRKAVEILDERGDPKEARKLLNENIKEYPKFIPSYLVLASMDRRDENYGAALKTIERAMENNHKNSDISDATLIWWKASIYDDMGDLQKALSTMQQAVKMGRKTDKENLIDMLEELAQIYYDLKQYDESDKVYKEMRSMDETKQLPIVGMARNLIAREKYDDALALLEECKKYDIDYPEIYRFQMRAFDGKKEYKKMIDAMVTLYEKSDDFDYLDVDVFKKDKKYSTAVIKQKIASERDNIAWKVILSEFYEECHKYPEAVFILSELMEEYGNETSLLETRSDIYTEMGMVKEALDDMTKCVELSEGGDAAYYRGMRAHIYRCNGQYSEAIEDLNAFIDYYPTEAYGYYARGWCKELSGDESAAFEDYNEGIAVDEDYPYIYLMRGEIYLKRGMTQEANMDFEQVIQKDTIVEDGTCRQYALHFLGRDDEALEWMDKLIDTDTDDPGHWYDKSCLLARMGRLEESLAALQTSFEKGYRKFAHIEHDDDMDPIRDREDFNTILSKYRSALEEEMRKSNLTSKEDVAAVVTEVGMKKMYGGTYEVACSVNGLPLKMIFDTGAADVTISSVEASFMLKNGYLSDNDVKGKKNYMTASGDIHEGTVLRLKEVKLGDAILKNVEASVVHSQKAPLLLGQSVLEKFGTITIDNVNSKLLIKQ
jgi:clan AA aspartic protease (TIGR02281 family)